MKILVACRYGIVCGALRKLVRSISPGCGIVEIADASTTCEMIRYHSPNILFLDLYSAHREGIRLATEIKSAFPHIITAVMASFDYVEYRKVIKDLGIDYFVPVEAMDRDLIKRIIGAAESRKVSESGVT